MKKMVFLSICMVGGIVAMEEEARQSHSSLYSKIKKGESMLPVIQTAIILRGMGKRFIRTPDGTLWACDVATGVFETAFEEETVRPSSRLRIKQSVVMSLGNHEIELETSKKRYVYRDGEFIQKVQIQSGTEHVSF